MVKWQRSFFQPVLPLGEDGRRVTGSKEHIALSRMAAGEGMVLLKNEKNTLPIRKGTKSHSLVRYCRLRKRRRRKWRCNCRIYP